MLCFRFFLIRLQHEGNDCGTNINHSIVAKHK